MHREDVSAGKTKIKLDACSLLRGLTRMWHINVVELLERATDLNAAEKIR